MNDSGDHSVITHVAPLLLPYDGTFPILPYMSFL